MIVGLIGFALALIIVYFAEKYAKPDKIDKYMKEKETLEINRQCLKSSNSQSLKVPKKFVIILNTTSQNFFNHIDYNWNYWNKPTEFDKYFIFNAQTGYSAVLAIMNGKINIMFLPKDQFNNNISDSELLFLINNFTQNVIVPYQNKYPEEISYKQIF